MEEEHIGEESALEIGGEGITGRLGEDSSSMADWQGSRKKAPEMLVGRLLGLLTRTLLRQG